MSKRQWDDFLGGLQLAGLIAGTAAAVPIALGARWMWIRGALAVAVLLFCGAWVAAELLDARDRRGRRRRWR